MDRGTRSDDLFGGFESFEAPGQGENAEEGDQAGGSSYVIGPDELLLWDTCRVSKPVWSIELIQRELDDAILQAECLRNAADDAQARYEQLQYRIHLLERALYFTGRRYTQATLREILTSKDWVRLGMVVTALVAGPVIA